MDLSFAGATDIGRKRSENQDAWLIDERLRLFVVADGMGGHAAGQVASRLCVEQLRDTLVENRDILDAYARGAAERPEVLRLLLHAVETAGTRIFQEAQKDEAMRGMGTTCSALIVLDSPMGERAFIAHVGDSRVYLSRGGQLHQITEDHSLLNELVRMGRVTRDNFEQSPYGSYKNAVTRAVGVYESVVADTLDLDLLPGDQFLLCSDGLHGLVSDDVLRGVLSGDAELRDLAEHLIGLANAAGGKDNITSLVLRVAPGAAPGRDARSQEINLQVDALRGMPVFKYLTYKELMRVLNAVRARTYQAGQEVFKEGAPGEELFIVLSGGVQLQKDGAFIAEVGAGDHFGEMALIDNSSRSATAIASDPTRVLVLARDEFYVILKNEAPLAVKILWSFTQVLAQRLRQTTTDLSGARIEAAAEGDEVLFEEE